MWHQTGDKVRLFDDSESTFHMAVTCFEKVCVEGADRIAVLATLWARLLSNGDIEVVVRRHSCRRSRRHEGTQVLPYPRCANWSGRKRASIQPSGIRYQADDCASIFPDTVALAGEAAIKHMGTLTGVRSKRSFVCNSRTPFTKSCPFGQVLEQLFP